MRDGKGIPNSKFEMRKLEENAHAKPANILLTPRSPRTQSPDAGRGADADREGRFDIMQKARMFVKVGWEERKQRFGIMQNVEMFSQGS